MYSRRPSEIKAQKPLELLLGSTRYRNNREYELRFVLRTISACLLAKERLTCVLLRLATLSGAHTTTIAGESIN
jgi:hypothetical protein